MSNLASSQALCLLKEPRKHCGFPEQLHLQSVLDITKSNFIQNNWYHKINFLIPENLLSDISSFRLIESMMELRPRQGNLRLVFRLFSLMRGLPSIRLTNLKTSLGFPC